MAISVITSSSLAREHDQIDGRFWVKETHTWDDGSVQELSYLCEPPIDPQQVMTDRVLVLNQAAVDQANYVPATVTSAQARSAILAAGLRPVVEVAVALSDQATQDLWYTAATIDRSNPVVIALGAQIGLTSAQLDGLFQAGSKLQ